MINLAGNEDCDMFIFDELKRAGIDIIPCKGKGEVPYRFEGRLIGNTFKFVRAWTYWMVSGNVPLNVAKKLYAHPEGKVSVRVAGHCGCPAPEEPWVTWIGKESKKPLRLRSVHKEKLKKYKESKTIMNILKEYEIVNSFEESGTPFITSYHIDTQAGLLLFATKLRQHYIQERKNEKA